MKIRLGKIAVLLVVLYSCKTVKNTPLDVQVGPQKTKQVIETSHGPYHPSKTRVWDLLHTKLEVGFDWQKQYLNGTATLSLRPYFYPANMLELDAKGMDIQKVELASKKGQDLKYSYDQKTLKINLDKTYNRKDSLSILIKYTAKPNELPKGGSAAITEDKGLYFINPDGSDKTKPRQIWTQGETEASSCWFPTIDATNERCTQEMYITVDTNFQVLTNGERVSSKPGVNGTKTEYWKMNLPHAPYLFMMAIGEFAVVEDKMPSGISALKDLKLRYYVEPKYAAYAKNIFGNTPEMIEFYSRILNYNYPWQKYSQVVVRDYVSGAMENTTATVFMEAVQVDDRELLDENWDGIIAHELFHHWFGDLATCESWANLPLNESFANYSEYLWTEHKYGRDEADFLAEKEKSEYFDEAQRKQEPLIRFHYKDKEDMFDRHSYNKGGRVLHMLRKYLGDEAFFTALNLYLVRNQYKSVEIHDLRLACEEVCGEDLNWFFDQWFLAPGHADLFVTHSYASGMLKLTVKQLQDSLTTPIYKLPVEVDIWVNGIKTRQKVTIHKATEEIAIAMPGQPELVIFDAEHQLLGKISHQKSKEEYIFQYQQCDLYLARLNALENLFTPDKIEVKGKENPKFTDPDIKRLLAAALQDRFWEIRDFAMNQFSTYLIPDIENYLKLFENIALNDPKPSVRAKAIYLLSSYNNKAYTYIYEKGINEKAYSVAGASLSAFLKSGDPAAVAKAKEYENSDNINIVIPLADYYTETKDTGKYEWFKEKMATGNAQKLYNLLAYFGQYVSMMDGPEKEDGKKVLQKIAKENKYEVIRQMADLYVQMIK
jgi:aminopeptidase N